MRMRGEAKDYTTAWLALGQRTLRYETYVMPVPEENVQQLDQAPAAAQRHARLAHFSSGRRCRLPPRRAGAPGPHLRTSSIGRSGHWHEYVAALLFTTMVRIGFAGRLRPQRAHIPGGVRVGRHLGSRRNTWAQPQRAADAGCSLACDAMTQALVVVGGGNMGRPSSPRAARRRPRGSASSAWWRLVGSRRDELTGRFPGSPSPNRHRRAPAW